MRMQRLSCVSCATIADVMANEKLTFKRVAMRAVSVLVCAAGGAASAYSLLIQFQEVGNIMASVCWFAGLFSLVGGISGYAVTCLGRKGKKHTWAAIVAGLVLGCLHLRTDASGLAHRRLHRHHLCVRAGNLALYLAFHFEARRPRRCLSGIAVPPCRLARLRLSSAKRRPSPISAFTMRRMRADRRPRRNPVHAP